MPQLLAPAWLASTDNLDEEPIIPEGMKGLDELADDIEKNMPILWEKAGEYDITQYERVPNPETNEMETQFPFKWTDEGANYFQDRSERAKYLIDNVADLSPLKEKSAYHNLDFNISERWNLSGSMMEDYSGGVPKAIATVSELLIDAIKKDDEKLTQLSDFFSDNYNKMAEDQIKIEKTKRPDFVWDKDSEDYGFAGDDFIGPATKEDYAYAREQNPDYFETLKKYGIELNNWKEEQQERENKGLRKEVNQGFLNTLIEINEWAEETSINHIEKIQKRQEKDLRFQAYSQYVSQKPVDWFTSFKSPEYFLDTVFSMVPSIAIMGGSLAALSFLGPGAAAFIGTAGHVPLVATGAYNEAYQWTLDKTGDEELAKSNAAYSSATQIAFTVATEGWGMSRIMKKFAPAVNASAKSKFLRNLYTKNIATPERVQALRNLKNTQIGKLSGYIIRPLRDPVAEGFQEYVQYGGQVMSEAGYKDEGTTNLASILLDPSSHPLVDPAEMHESVVGGALMGAGITTAGYVHQAFKWNKFDNKANRILNDNYGIETGVPNARFDNESMLLDSPVIETNALLNAENYFRELINPFMDVKVNVDRTKDTKSRLASLIKQQDTYGMATPAEKFSEAIKSIGQNEINKIDNNVLNDVNDYLIGTVESLSPELLKVFGDNPNIIQAILDNKISIESKKAKGNTKKQNRKISITDKSLLDSVIQAYESEISENLGESATSTSTKNYLSSTFNINIDNAINNQIQSSLDRHVFGEVDKSIEKQVDQQIEREIDKQTEQAIDKQKGVMPSKTDPTIETESQLENYKRVLGKQLKEYDKDPLAYMEKDLQSWYDLEKKEGKSRGTTLNINEIKDAIAEFKAKQQTQKFIRKEESPTTESTIETESPIVKQYKNELVNAAKLTKEYLIEDFRDLYKDELKSGEVTEDNILEEAQIAHQSLSRQANKKNLKEFEKNPLKHLENELEWQKKREKIESKGKIWYSVRSLIIEDMENAIKELKAEKTDKKLVHKKGYSEKKVNLLSKGKYELKSVSGKNINFDWDPEGNYFIYKDDNNQYRITDEETGNVLPGLSRTIKGTIEEVKTMLLQRGITKENFVEKANKIRKKEKEQRKKIKEEKIIEPTPSTVKKDIDPLVKKRNKLKGLKAQRKVIAKNKGNLESIDRAILKLEKELGIKKEKDTPKTTDKTKAPTKTPKVSPQMEAEMKIEKFSKMEGVTIKRAGPGPEFTHRIGTIIIAEELRNKGVGTEIVNAFKDLFKAKNRDKIEIIAKTGSEDFWVKQGFVKYGVSSQPATDKDGNIYYPDKMRFWINEPPLDQVSSDINEQIIENTSRLPKVIDNYMEPSKAFQYLDGAFKVIKDQYGIDIADFVPPMSRSLNVIEDLEKRKSLKRLLNEWAVERDPSIASKMKSNNNSLKIIDLMGLGGIKSRRIKAQISDLNVVSNISNALDNQGSEDSHDISREGLSISDISDVEEISNNMTFDTYDFVGDKFFKFLESTSEKGFLDQKQTAELMDQVSINDYDSFLGFLNKKYKYTPETINDNNMVKNFWVRNQPINRQDSVNKPSFWYANLTEDGKKISNKDSKNLIPKIGGHPKYGKDIRNNKDLPRTTGVSFLDYDNDSYDWNFGYFQYSRIYLKDIVDVFKGEEKGSFYSKPSYTELSGALVRNWDKKFSQYADQDGFARTVVGVKSGSNNPSFVIAKASQDIMDVASDDQSIRDYLDYEISIGNLTDEMSKEILESIKNEISKGNKYSAAQHILSHEVLKRWRGRDYLMRSPLASHHSRRLAIDDGDGIVAIGTGDYTIKIVDQSKVFVSKGIPNSTSATKKQPLSSYVGGLENKNHSDGSLWVESEYLDQTAEAIGRVPNSPNSSKLREIKTRIRFISKNDEFGNKHYKEGTQEIEGTHYLALKHNEFVPEEDIYITDENDNVIVYTANVNGNIRIFDSEDNRITMFGTLDEAKEPDGGSGSFKLNNRISTDILTLPEESRRIVKIPKQQGHNSAAFPWSWLSHLHNPEFDKLRNLFSTKMNAIAKMNMDVLFSTRNNSQTMRSLMGQMKSDGLSIMSEVDRLLEPSPGQMISDGFMHPHIITGMSESIKNRMLKENSYGGRRRGLGSYPVLKSDLARNIVKKEDGVVISADDVTMLRFLQNLLNVDGTGNELINNINEALRSRKEYLMVGRWPVYAPSAVFLAKIEKVMPKGHGAVAWLHPESIVGKMQADHDGDNGFLLAPYFGDNYQDKSIIKAMQSDSIKKAFENMDSFVRLEYFKKKDKKYKLTKKADMYTISGKLGKGINSQGILMNSVSFLEDMYFKGFKAEVGGQTIVPKNPDKETEIMNYAQLNDDITQEMLDKAKMGTLVHKDGSKWESGDKYLKTTPIKQLHILLQSAVDNAKEFLLADWGYNGYKFVIPKMFTQENGSPIGLKQVSTMTSLIRKELMHNQARRGVSNVDNNSQDIESMFALSKDMHEMTNMSGVEQGEIIRNKANGRRLRYGERSRLYKDTMEIDKIIFNNKNTPLEQLLSIPHQSLLDYESLNPNDKVHNHPLGYHPNRITRGIVQTQKDLYTIQKETQRWYPETKEFSKDKEVARRFINESTREFYNIMMDAVSHQDKTKSLITSSGYPYQEELIKYIEKWKFKGDKKKGLPSWDKMSEEQKAYSTLRFLRGVLTLDGKNNVSRNRDVEKLLPMPLMHQGVYTEFMNRFGPNLREASNERITLKSQSRYEDINDKTIEQLLKDCP